VPAAATVGIDLIEDGDPGPALLDEMIDEAAGLVLVGGAEVEDEGSVRALAERAGTGEGAEEVDALLLVALEQRQDAGHGRRADVAEEQQGVVLTEQRARVGDGGCGIVAIVVGTEDDAAAVDAARAVDLGEAGRGTAIQFDAEAVRGAGEGGGHADDDR